ncbi:hypothetical protein GTP41_01885 [Pseudoduganella sp. DS3]|uniref:Uncharacterized protein n=1 Tax=Pseudoduganella guangdongensis TaxID=2692179 RepID=A0A6N9HBB9_9BURK|nr:hypothetical protein [Pseudoduganella guangdongensis]MYN00841.1 hypothetical protein [Pseudoduganella guangdongensis]
MDRIVLRTVARELNEAELSEVSGGVEQPGGAVTGGQPTKKSSSPDPSGPQDPDTSLADWD